MAERRISEFEDKSIKIFQAIMQIEKIKKKKKKNRISPNLWDNFKVYNWYTRRRRENRVEKTL